MLAIGEFSRMTHLSIRTLRRYHEVGLLEPEMVDASSGYRYYSGDQIPIAQVIHRLRELDVLAGIGTRDHLEAAAAHVDGAREPLERRDPRGRLEILTGHWKRS